MFEHVEPFGGDPILSLNEDFQRDPRPGKINLSIGIYFDDAGRIPVLDSVRQAETQVVARNAPKPYLPIEGAANFREEVQKLLFGAVHEVLAAGRVATIQSVGSSGGLKVGADFIARWLPGSEVWVSDPSWENHRSMFEGAGLPVHSYPYYDATTGALAFDAMCETLRRLPAKSVVLLHACCHNPTGVDLSRAQWDQLIPLLAERDLLRLSGIFQPDAAKAALQPIDSVEILQADEHLLIVALPDASRRLPAIFSALAAAGAEVRGTNLTQPSLESLFIKLTGKELRE